MWAELGAAMPEAGGSYAFLREIYGRNGAGRWASFLYIWQLGFSAPLSIASGCIGLAQYAAYLWPSLSKSVLRIPHLHYTSLLRQRMLPADSGVALPQPEHHYAAGVDSMGRRAADHRVGYHRRLHALSSSQLAMPPGAFHLTPAFFQGLGAATLIATYDYWGYYTVCFLGGEVRNPGRTIPRAVLFSIAVVAVLYLLMNISVLGVIPWQRLMKAATDAMRWSQC